MGDDDRPGPLLPAAHSVVLLPLRRAPGGVPAPGGRRAVGGGRVLRPPLRGVPAPVRLGRPGLSLGRPLQGGRAALAAGHGGPPSLPPRGLPAPRLRPREDAEPRGLLPPRVPPRAPRLAPRGEPRSAGGPRGLPRRRPPARPAQDAGPLLPDQLPLHRDHERLQLQVHVVPGRDHGAPARLHEEGAGLPHPGRGRGEEVLARPPLSGEAPPDGRAHAPPGPRPDRGPGRGGRGSDRAQHQLRPHHRGA